MSTEQFSQSTTDDVVTDRKRRTSSRVPESMKSNLFTGLMCDEKGKRRDDVCNKIVKESTDKSGLGYDSQMNESEVVHSVFNSRESDVDDSLVNDRFKTGEGFHAVPPPYTGN
ncbi:hypothetical protein Tco_0664367 [Tanacetum coccineum]